MPFEGGWVPVLVGVGPRTSGDVHVLQGVSVLAFADGRLMLDQTGLAQRDVVPSGQGVGSIEHLLEWVMSSSSDVAEGGRWSLPAWLIGRMGAPEAAGVTSVASDPGTSASGNAAGDLPAPPRSEGEASEAQAADMDAPPPSAPGNALPAPKAIPMERTWALAVESEAPVATQPSAGALLNSSARAPLAYGYGTASPAFFSPASTQALQINEVRGTAGPDELWGTEGSDLLDGLYNTEVIGTGFYESLWGAGGDDRLSYRGFGGDAAVTDVRAHLDGGAGDDVFEVSMDGRTLVTLADASGFDGLVLQTSLGVASPWASDYLDWHWNWSSGAPLLQANYVDVDAVAAGFVELEPGLDWVASGASNATLLVRPTAGEALLKGTTASDWLLADVGTQRLEAGAGNDVVLAKAGVTVSLGAGINTLYADSNDYTLSYEDSPMAVRVNLANRLGLVFDESANVHAIDRLMDAPLSVMGSEHDDDLVGNGADNTLRTGGGADRLLGGGGADHFIVDVNSLKQSVKIGDWNTSEGDKLTLNLNGMSGESQGAYAKFELRNHQQEMLLSKNIGDPIEEGALLSLLLTEAADTLYWADAPGKPQAWVEFDAPADSLTAEQWATVLSVDYL
jgi:hypothetical protein